MFEIPIYVKVSDCEFLDIVDRNCVYIIISDEIDIIFISQLKEMTLQQYIKQPRSMLCRKLERYYIEEPYKETLDPYFLPYYLRQIGFKPSPLLNISLPWMK